MGNRLTGKTILITGGCGDIGRAVAEASLDEGADQVVVVDLPDALASGSVWPPRVRLQACDVADRGAVDDLFAALRHDGCVADVVVVNAGIVESQPALEVTPMNWRRTIEVNLTGAFHIAQAAAAILVAQGRSGVLIFTGSWVADVPSRGIMPYCVSKAGLQMLARCMALELAPHGIRANVVAPGVIDAGVSGQIFREFPERRAPFEAMVPLGTLGTPAQVAQAAVFLGSDAASYITGATLRVDGGASLFNFQPSGDKDP